MTGAVAVILCVAVELTDGRGAGEVGGGAKPYDGENAWSSINHSILSGAVYAGEVLTTM